MAEAHPVGFRWAMKARERGATIIHVDPRFSRTSAMLSAIVPFIVRLPAREETGGDRPESGRFRRDAGEREERVGTS